MLRLLIRKGLKIALPSACNSSVSFQLVNSDIWGPASSIFCVSLSIYIISIDDFTHFCWLYPAHHKYEAFQVFQSFKLLIENQFDHKIKILGSDNEGEENTLVMLLDTFSFLMELSNNFHVHSHLNKMG